ncbi:MAG: hypothetical protein J7M30_06690 [Deltaproteobacteria bacterium]|nr:hypothetical protein [Deltaproteobacteria bacterium]
MPDTFAITIIFIALVTIIGAFARRRSRDKCLIDFTRDPVIIETTDGKTIWGKLRVENTGLELLYEAEHKNEDGHMEMSYILYKQEYSSIRALLRNLDQLSEQGKKNRESELKRTYHPSFFRRMSRKTLNFFKTVRDSVMEVLNLLVSQVKKTTPAGQMLTSQDKYVSQLKQELIGSVGTSYEPLLERYIGHKVVLELIKDDKILEFAGVLKEYTIDFIEVMNVDYRLKDNQSTRKADIIVLRKYGIIRHKCE